MSKVTFITGNQAKVDFLAKYFGYPIEHHKLELDEIQSLDLREISEYKARQAYANLKTPVLVEDAGFVIKAMHHLPGPLIKWFHTELGLDGVCRIADIYPSREATISVCFTYFDGTRAEFFEGFLNGEVSDKPRGTNGFGFDPIFIPDGRGKTLAEMSDEELGKYSLRTSTVYPKIKTYVENLDKK